MLVPRCLAIVLDFCFRSMKLDFCLDAQVVSRRDTYMGSFGLCLTLCFFFLDEVGQSIKGHFWCEVLEVETMGSR